MPIETNMDSCVTDLKSKGLKESGGTVLAMGAVVDGEFLKRSGSTIIGGAVAAFTNTAVKTAAYTAANLDRVLVNANGAAGDFAVTLKASPSAGDKIRVVMVTEHATRKVTINDNASLINGGAANDVYYTLCLVGDEVEFTYDSTAASWLVTYDGILCHTCALAANAAITLGNNTYTKITVDTEEYDIGNIGDIATNDRVDIRRAGKYRMTASGSVNNVAGTITECLIYKNGSALRSNFWVGTTSNYAMMPVIEENTLASGDYIEFYMRQYSGGGTGPTEVSGAYDRPKIIVTEIRP